MIRMVLGGIIALFGLILDIGTIITALYVRKRFDDSDIAGIMISTMILAIGVLLFYFGHRFYKRSRGIIELTFRSSREKSNIDIEELLRISGGSEILIKKSINYAIQKGWVTKENLEYLPITGFKIDNSIEIVQVKDTAFGNNNIDILELKKANRKIVQAYTAAIFSGFITLCYTIISTVVGRSILGISIWNIIDVFFVFGLAFGIYKKNRACAVIIFIYFLLSKAIMFTRLTLPSIISSTFVGLIFAYYYYQGIVGTYAYHRLQDNEDKILTPCNEGINKTPEA